MAVDMNQVKKEVMDEVEDPKKSEPIQAKLKEISKDLTELTLSVKEQLQVLPLTELNYMKENYDYMQDYAIS